MRLLRNKQRVEDDPTGRGDSGCSKEALTSQEATLVPADANPNRSSAVEVGHKVMSTLQALHWRRTCSRNRRGRQCGWLGVEGGQQPAVGHVGPPPARRAGLRIRSQREGATDGGLRTLRPPPGPRRSLPVNPVLQPWHRCLLVAGIAEPSSRLQHANGAGQPGPTRAATSLAARLVLGVEPHKRPVSAWLCQGDTTGSSLSSLATLKREVLPRIGRLQTADPIASSLTDGAFVASTPLPSVDSNSAGSFFARLPALDLEALPQPGVALVVGLNRNNGDFRYLLDEYPAAPQHPTRRRPPASTPSDGCQGWPPSRRRPTSCQRTFPTRRCSS